MNCRYLTLKVNSIAKLKHRHLAGPRLGREIVAPFGAVRAG